ncbi:MAG: hypothetical protein MJE68_18745 [Proteobacteria bacterium]|nr:hypothetical protein [Pseudomonadota bacterium]
MFYSVQVIPPEEERVALPLGQEHDTQCLATSNSLNEATSPVAEQREDSSSPPYFTPPGSDSLSPADSSEEIH